jgi:hypothetical protein
LTNPQTLNKYRYGLNNPIRYVDSNGLYEKDVHQDLTVALAYAAGFSMSEAGAIGSKNQRIDDDPKTNPFASIQARRLYHFTTEERRDQLWNQSLGPAYFALAGIGNPENIGQKLLMPWGCTYMRNRTLFHRLATGLFSVIC